MNPKHKYRLYEWKECVHGAQSWKKRWLLCESIVIAVDQQTLIAKNGTKWSFSYETKTSISFIPMRRMSLWCPIMKRKEIIMWIYVYPDWQMKFYSKKWWEVKFLLWKQSLNVIYPNEQNVFWCPIMERKEIITWIHIYPNW